MFVLIGVHFIETPSMGFIVYWFMSSFELLTLIVNCLHRHYIFVINGDWTTTNFHCWNLFHEYTPNYSLNFTFWQWWWFCQIYFKKLFAAKETLCDNNKNTVCFGRFKQHFLRVVQCSLIYISRNKIGRLTFRMTLVLNNNLGMD